MANRLELSWRAALCRQLAQREPHSKIYWMAEAEHWLSLSRAPICTAPADDRDPLVRLGDLTDQPSGF